MTTELRDVLAGRAPTAGDVPNLRYTEWVLREVMRLYPPAWAIAREALADCELDGYHVPKGTLLRSITLRPRHILGMRLQIKGHPPRPWA
ncbi:MAG: cytochrome P450 [Isosphaerales bacterium]